MAEPWLVEETIGGIHVVSIKSSHAECVDSCRVAAFRDGARIGVVVTHSGSVPRAQRLELDPERARALARALIRYADVAESFIDDLLTKAGFPPQLSSPPPTVPADPPRSP